MSDEPEVAAADDQERPQNGVVVYREDTDEGVRITWGTIGTVDPLAVPAILRRAASDAAATLGVG